MKYMSIIVYMVFATLGVTFMKLGGSSIHLKLYGNFELSIGYISLLGFLFYFASFFVWQKLLVKFQISFIIPFTAGILQVGVLLISIFVFNEEITSIKLAGVVFIIIGIIFISTRESLIDTGEEV